jgi:hypothetical protein
MAAVIETVIFDLDGVIVDSEQVWKMPPPRQRLDPSGSRTATGEAHIEP